MTPIVPMGALPSWPALDTNPAEPAAKPVRAGPAARMLLIDPAPLLAALLLALALDALAGDPAWLSTAGCRTRSC